MNMLQPQMQQSGYKPLAPQMSQTWLHEQNFSPPTNHRRDDFEDYMQQIDNGFQFQEDEQPLRSNQRSDRKKPKINVSAKKEGNYSDDEVYNANLEIDNMISRLRMSMPAMTTKIR